MSDAKNETQYAGLEVPLSEEDAHANRVKLTATKTAWKRAATHDGIVCPSGTVVSIKLPNLPKLAEAGEIPNELVDLATAAEQVTPGQVPQDVLGKLSKLQDFIVAETVVKPEIKPEEVADLPYEDLEFLAELAHRRRDVDALGNQIAGLDKLDKYATFRDLNDSDEVALDS